MQGISNHVLVEAPTRVKLRGVLGQGSFPCPVYSVGCRPPTVACLLSSWLPFCVQGKGLNNQIYQQLLIGLLGAAIH